MASSLVIGDLSALFRRYYGDAMSAYDLKNLPRDQRLMAHYIYVADFGSQHSSYWHQTVDVLWSAFCMTWVTVAWAMLIGKE